MPSDSELTNIREHMQNTCNDTSDCIQQKQILADQLVAASTITHGSQMGGVDSYVIPVKAFQEIMES